MCLINMVQDSSLVGRALSPLQSVSILAASTGRDGESKESR